MALKERILEIEEQDRGRNKGNLAPQPPTTEEWAASYEKQLQDVDSMILRQRVLFKELEEIGLIAMLEEMTGEGNVRRPRTRAEQEEDRVEFDKDFQANVKKNSERMKAQDRGEIWTAHVEGPQKLPDDSLDEALNIRLTMSGHSSFNTSRWSEVLITYGTDRTLRVYGQNTDYVGKIDADLNLERLEKGLAHAFHEPAYRSDSKGTRVSKISPRIRIGASSS